VAEESFGTYGQLVLEIRYVSALMAKIWSIFLCRPDSWGYSNHSWDVPKHVPFGDWSGTLSLSLSLSLTHTHTPTLFPFFPPSKRICDIHLSLPDSY
jgi:hypothetical protein